MQSSFALLRDKIPCCTFYTVHEFKLTSNYVEIAIKEDIGVIFHHSEPMSLEILVVNYLK